MRSMFSLSRDGKSLLPEDYLERRHQRRANMLCLSLFVVVLAGVVGAFIVTHGEWSGLKTRQESIDARYRQAARDIEQLKVLEAQKSQILDKAEIATALIEKAPRSIVVAELVNRLPVGAAMMEIELESRRIQPAPPAPPAGRGAKSLAGKASEDEAKAKPAPPRFDTTLNITGVAMSHNDVARYVSALQDCELLRGVELKFSEIALSDNQEVNKFKVEASLRNDVDARRVRLATDPVRSEADATPRED